MSVKTIGDFTAVLSSKGACISHYANPDGPGESKIVFEVSPPFSTEITKMFYYGSGKPLHIRVECEVDD